VERIVFVGPGRLGLGLGYALAQSGEVGRLHFYGRRPEPPEHPLFDSGMAEFEYGLDLPPEGTTALFLTVPDAALPEVAHSLALKGDAPAGCSLFHTSGALGLEVLTPLHDRGYSVGSLHPLRAVADHLGGLERFRGTFFALSGEPEALRTGARILRLLDGRGLTIPTSRRPLYHAAAVIASNHLVFLLREAIDLLRETGVPEEEAREAMVSLAQGTLENVADLGLERALTGPLLRGDVETIELHLRALTPERASFYVASARRGLEWLKDELPAETVAKLDALFTRYE
jgi:predicted short-subunit dehydrogenase-like oxidoreductase (DUF2520 family)